MRELNSFSSYLFDNRGLYDIDEEYRNYFEPYLKLIEKVSKQANAIPIEDIDAIFVAAQQKIVWLIVCLHFYIEWDFLQQK